MNKLLSLSGTAVVGLVVLVAAGPTIGRLAVAVTPLVSVLAIFAIVGRVVWYLTRDRW